MLLSALRRLAAGLAVVDVGGAARLCALLTARCAAACVDKPGLASVVPTCPESRVVALLAAGATVAPAAPRVIGHRTRMA
ncbi:hypothetical protein C1S81_10620 [Mycolicibacterium neoaurum]|nr:hypothetical protein C1S81_10620 [Mycolicibacterium neoaurum]